ncbi:MAG: GNAT family N-acetyltransferase [Planctomycetaceae bacterium]
MYRIERAQNSAALLGNPDLWDALAGNSPFRQSAWLDAWWHHFGDDERAFFIVARDPIGEINGILPLYSSRPNGGSLRFVGDGQACSDGLSVLCAPADAESVGFEMGHWLATQAASGENRWNLMDLDGVIAGDAAMISLMRGLTEGGAAVHTQSRMHTWFKPTTDSWEQYLSTLSKPRRRSTRKLSQRIDETLGLSRHVSQTETELQCDLDSMIELHQRRWIEAGHAGSFADPLFRSFIHESARRFLRAGRLRMQTLRHHDKVIAGELQMICTDGTITIYSTGMDTQSAAMEPGRIMTIETLRYAYEQGSPGIDYLRGDEPYKAQLGAQPRRVARLRIVPGTARGRLQLAAWKGAFELKQWARRQTGSDPVVVLPGLAIDTTAVAAVSP